MINHTYRLISPKQIRVDFINEFPLENEIVVRPLYLSICAADQRYYQGLREKSALEKKLPMALIHETVGEVTYDPKGEFSVGTKVVLIPNIPIEGNEIIKENYLRSSHFRSSGYDGFMQNLIFIDRNVVIPYHDLDDKIAVLLELFSVSMNALEHFENYSHVKKQTIGVWGNGSLGFIMSLILKKTFPNSEILIFGTRYEKLQYFQFADGVYEINHIPADLKIDHAFECVGGPNASDAINQIIDIINPQGTIALLGVSEQNVPINTRMILEKGLSLLGNSRSGYEDFDNSIKFLEKYKDATEYLYNIISAEVVIRKIEDIHKAFEIDKNNEFKTIMKWEI